MYFLQGDLSCYGLHPLRAGVSDLLTGGCPIVWEAHTPYESLSSTTKKYFTLPRITLTLWYFPPPCVCSFILLAVQGKLLHDPSRPKIQIARALPPLDDESSPAPGNRIFWPLAPVLEGACPEVLPSLSLRSREEEV